MGALAGVARVDYDCKTATVTMKLGATLTEDAARAALDAKKLAMSSFRDGPAPAVQVHLFAVTGMPTGARDAVLAHLRAALPEADEVVLDAGARALVRMAKGKAATEPTITRALAEKGLGVSGHSTAAWPDTLAAYALRLGGASGDAAPDVARSTLAAVDKVLAAFVFDDGASARIYLREPCAQIETAARGALAAKGFTLESIDVIPARQPSPAPAPAAKGEPGGTQPAGH